MGSMRILVLSRRESLYSTRRLVQAGEKKGHTMIVADPLQCTLTLRGENPQVFFRGRKMRGIQAAIPRIGAAIADYGLIVLSHLEMMGVPVLNSSRSIALARDKFLSLQVLSRHGIDTPRTVLIRSPHVIDRAMEIVGGPPVILKVSQGTHGVGVIFAESRQAVESTLEALWNLGQDILIQEYVRESFGRDIRALVLDGKVVAAVRRHARLREFRSNIHRGAIGIPLELKEKYRTAAVTAAGAMGLRLAGIDIVEGKGGPKVVEVNASPGLEGIERASGRNIAAMIIAHTVRMAGEAAPKEPAALMEGAGAPS